MSEAKEFLPFTDPDQPHFLDDPAQRHIDTYFRLFRHDIFGELKGALANLMHTLMHDATAISNPNLKLGDVRAYQYADAHIRNVEFERGLEAHITFQPPTAIRKKKTPEQQKWLEDSRRLEDGCLLSFIWMQGGVVQHIFLTLTNKDVKEKLGDVSFTVHNVSPSRHD